MTVTSVGIIEKELQQTIEIFPNPSNNGVFNIRFPKAIIGGFRLKVFNMLGMEILSREFTGRVEIQQIDLSGQPDGIYTVSLSTDREVITKKVVINNR